MSAVLDSPASLTMHGREYLLGLVPSDRGGTHQVILVLAAEGENSAAARGTLLLSAFPSVTDVLMVGIAGGVPHPEKPDRHVRLGDIVVSGEGGVVQYDYVTDSGRATAPRHLPRPPSARLLDAVRLLESEELRGERPWLPAIERSLKALHARRPAAAGDVLADTKNPATAIPHPHDPARRRGQPRVFRGAIASANRLLKNARRRDAIRDRYGVRAVEMEGSGIADAAWTAGAGYLVVRGVCDYCDGAKGDAWQLYAAAAAAGYTRSLLASMPVTLDPRMLVSPEATALPALPPKRLASEASEGPSLILRDFTFYGTDPYHPPEEGPYYPPDLAEAPSAAVSFTIASASPTPIRLQNIYLRVEEAEPLRRATFPVYERGNGATPILSWAVMGDGPGTVRVMSERRSRVGTGLDPSDFHVRVFSGAGRRYRVGVEADWIDLEQQDRAGRHAFPETFSLDVPALVKWEELARGARRVRALFDSSAPFLAEALGAMEPAPDFTILAMTTFPEEASGVRRGANCYPVGVNDVGALTALMGVRRSAYDEGPLQFLLIDCRVLLLQDDQHVDEATIIEDPERLRVVEQAFGELARRLGTQAAAPA